MINTLAFYLGECLLPVNMSNLELTRLDPGDNTSSLNLTIVLRCRDGFSPVNDREAVCSSNGTWVPDLEEFACHNIAAVVLSEILCVYIAVVFLSLVFHCTLINLQLCTHADNGSRNNAVESHQVNIIIGSVVGSATLLLCVLFAATVICIKLCFKKSATLSQDGPADLPVYDSITSPVYECLNPTVYTVMAENEVYNTSCKEVRAYEIISD